MTICLNRSVLDFMASILTPESFVLEFGAGGSSLWFANRCGRLLSIETSLYWVIRVRYELAGSACDWDVWLSTDPAVELSGVSRADLALIDGGDRNVCAQLAWGILKSGGWLVFDDAQREQYAVTVDWLHTNAEARRLEWAPGDVESATGRLALAWQKP